MRSITQTGTFTSVSLRIMFLQKIFLLLLVLIYCTVLQLCIDPKETTSCFLPLPGITVKIGKTNGFASTDMESVRIKKPASKDIDYLLVCYFLLTIQDD